MPEFNDGDLVQFRISGMPSGTPKATLDTLEQFDDRTGRVIQRDVTERVGFTTVRFLVDGYDVPGSVWMLPNTSLTPVEQGRRDPADAHQRMPGLWFMSRSSAGAESWTYYGPDEPTENDKPEVMVTHAERLEEMWSGEAAVSATGIRDFVKGLSLLAVQAADKQLGDQIKSFYERTDRLSKIRQAVAAIVSSETVMFTRDVAEDGDSGPEEEPAEDSDEKFCGYNAPHHSHRWTSQGRGCSCPGRGVR